MNYASRANTALGTAETLADRFDDGSENSGTLAIVESLAALTYAVLALVEVERSRS